MTRGDGPRPARPAGWAFLDRDGTLNVKADAGEYVRRPAELALLPGAAGAVRMLNEAGIWTGLVTNQRGVALGHMSLADLDAVHARLHALLAEEGARLDALYVCPHNLGECDCRKPGPGMLLQARREHPQIEWSRSAIVGDSASDIEAGRSLGLTTVLLGGGGRATGADHVLGDLAEAARLLVARWRG